MYSLRQVLVLKQKVMPLNGSLRTGAPYEDSPETLGILVSKIKIYIKKSMVSEPCVAPTLACALGGCQFSSKV